MIHYRVKTGGPQVNGMDLLLWEVAQRQMNLHVIPFENNFIMSGTLIWSFRHLEHKNLSSKGWYDFLVLFLVTREAVVPLANDSIMSGTSIWSFRHLEHKNPSSNGWDNFLVPFLATREAVAPLANDPIISGRSIWSFRHLKHQNLSISDDFMHSSSSFFGHQGGSGTTYKWSYHVARLIQLFRHLEIKILPNLRPVALQTGEIFFSSSFGHQGGSGTTCRWSSHVFRSIWLF